MTTENPIVAANAVTPDALPMNQLALIGLFFAGHTRKALLRTPQGDIAKVTVGDRVGRQEIIAIAEDMLILAAPNGAQTVLQMPS